MAASASLTNAKTKTYFGRFEAEAEGRLVSYWRAHILPHLEYKFRGKYFTFAAGTIFTEDVYRLLALYDNTPENTAKLIPALAKTAVQFAADGWGGYITVRFSTLYFDGII